MAFWVLSRLLDKTPSLFLALSTHLLMLSWMLILGGYTFSLSYCCIFLPDSWYWNRFFADRHAVWYLSSRWLCSMKSATNCSLKTITLLDFTSKGIPLLLSCPLMRSLHPSFLSVSFFCRRFWDSAWISYLKRPVKESNWELTIISIASYLFNWFVCLKMIAFLFSLSFRPRRFWLRFLMFCRIESLICLMLNSWNWASTPA